MVDLIPAEYRRARQAQRMLQRCALACVVLVCATGAARAGLEYLLQAEQAASAIAKSRQSQANAIRGRAAELDRRRQDALHTLDALERLRGGGASIERLVLAVDEAFDRSIWFRELSFAREIDGIDVRSRPGQGPGPTGSSAPAPAAAGATRAGAGMLPTLRENAHIKAHALDHASLADFVRQLQAGDGIAQVRLQDTQLRSYTSAQVVDFELELSLAAPGKERR